MELKVWKKVKEEKEKNRMRRINYEEGTEP